MKKKHLIVSALMAALLGASASGFAQDRHHGNDRDRGRDHERYSQQGRDHERHGAQGFGERRRWDGAGPSHDLRRGDRLPSRYRNHQYVVNNWREHRLRPPPRGYHWVQTGGDYVLAAIASGVIADLIINH